MKKFSIKKPEKISEILFLILVSINIVFICIFSREPINLQYRTGFTFISNIVVMIALLIKYFDIKIKYKEDNIFNEYNIASLIIMNIFLVLKLIIFWLFYLIHIEKFAIYLNIIIICIIYIKLDELDDEFKDRISKYLDVYILFKVIFSCISLVLIIIGSNAFNSNQLYSQLADNIEEREFLLDFKAITYSDDLIVVDLPLAEDFGDEKIALANEITSNLDKGSYKLSVVNGKPEYVSAIEYGGNYWKFKSNLNNNNYFLEVSPYYANGTKLTKTNMKYQTGGFFKYDVIKHIRNNGYANKGLKYPRFELDDLKTPYYVVSVFEHRTLYNKVFNITGTITVNSETGQINYYELGEEPNWIDIIYPKEVIEKQVENYSKFANGWINIANIDTFDYTSLERVYVNDKLYYYTELSTHGGNHNPYVASLYINPKTGKAYKYNINGASSKVAKNVALGKVKEEELYSDYSLLLNVQSRPTQFVIIKKHDLIKYYAFVNVENHNVIGVGATIDAALTDYVGLINIE